MGANSDNTRLLFPLQYHEQHLFHMNIDRGIPYSYCHGPGWAWALCAVCFFP
uniref:Uncharacterized protein n=1 Tax=Setaria italica TaxID=4555 RepID=K3ZGK3_SETIT